MQIASGRALNCDIKERAYWMILKVTGQVTFSRARISPLILSELFVEPGPPVGTKGGE